MTDKQKEVISLYVQETYKKSLPQIKNALMTNITDDMDRDSILTRMILNSILVSVDLSSQFLIEILQNHNVLNFLENEDLQKTAFKIRTDLADL